MDIVERGREKKEEERKKFMEDLQEKKRELGREIFKLILAFTEETDVRVTNIEMDTVNTCSMGSVEETKIYKSIHVGVDI